MVSSTSGSKKEFEEVKERPGAELQDAGFHINIKDLLS